VGLSIGDVGYNGEYPFPTDLLKPVRLEVSYDGTNWIKCNIYDNSENERSEYVDSQLAGTFSEAGPRVDFTRDSYKLRPPKISAGDIANGIYIEYEKRQTDLTASDSPDFEENLHNILSFDMAMDEYLMHTSKHDANWKMSFDIERAKSEDRFRDYYKNRFKRNFRIYPKFNNYR
jgi:hypothetical protein